MATYDTTGTECPPRRRTIIMAGPSISDELNELHNTYVWEVNAAVDRDDDYYIAVLANEYTERALRVMTTPRVAS
jgi:hypothetical protein